MADILKLVGKSCRTRSARGSKPVGLESEAEVIIFPGVRYERHADGLADKLENNLRRSKLSPLPKSN